MPDFGGMFALASVSMWFWFRLQNFINDPKAFDDGGWVFGLCAVSISLLQIFADYCEQG